jgi:subtilisin-like proprotein convertase family protein
MKTKLLLSALFLSAMMQAQTYSSIAPVVMVDANSASGCGSGATGVTEVTGTINVPLSATLTDPTTLTINLAFTHTWLSDIVAEIETPAGGRCALMKRVGVTATPPDTACGSGSDLVAANILSFNSANATPVATTNPVPGGNYAPSGVAPTVYPNTVSLCNLATFLNGVAINGDWIIHLSDHGGGDGGQLTSWSIVYTGLGGEEFVFTNAVSVLGNPFENELVVKVNNLSTSTAVMNLYSMDGKLVNTTNVYNFAETTSIDTSKLTQGVYLLVADIDGVTQKAIRVIKK